MTLLGSGVVPVVVVQGPMPQALVVVVVPPRNVNPSEGIDPTQFSEAEDGPEFSSQ